MTDEIWLGNDVWPLTADERRVTTLAMLAVAATKQSLQAGPDVPEEYVTSLNAGTGLWRSLLHDELASIDHSPGLLAVLVASINPMLDAEAAWDGRLTQRMNGILDILQVPFSAEDVHGCIEAVSEPVRGATQTTASRRTVAAGATGAAFLAGLHGQVWAGKYIGKAGDYLNRRFSSSDLFVERIIEIVVASRALSDTDERDGLAVLRLALSSELYECSRSGADIRRQHDRMTPERASERQRLAATLRPVERQLRVLVAATELMPQADADDDPGLMPDLVGLTLTEAKTIAAALGVQTEAFDVVAPGGNTRWIMSDKNWRVSRHEPQAGAALRQAQTVRLGCKHLDDIR